MITCMQKNKSILHSKGGVYMFKKILVPVDGSENSWRALEQAIILGENFDGELLIIHA